MLDELLDDLRAEHDELLAIVQDADLDTAVPAEPWDIRDTASHLMVGDAKGLMAAADPDAFNAELPAVFADPEGFIASWLEAGEGLTKDELLDRWHQGFEQMVKA
ncbi:MAG: wyosine base formation protein, partial [Frankiales bacterium]|nr:wyosine base formation protein [Frankiales bacterium]